MMPQKSWGSSYLVKFSNDGWNRFKKLDKSVANRVLEKVEGLSNFRTLNNVKKLEGEKDMYRLRVGDVRVIFGVEEDKKRVLILEMGFRGSIYR